MDAADSRGLAALCAQPASADGAGTPLTEGRLTMCGIAGIIHRGKTANIGGEMTAMLQSMKHRGPDSTGYSVYGRPGDGELVLRFKVAEQEDLGRGFDIRRQLKERRAEVDRRLQSLGAEIVAGEEATEPRKVGPVHGCREPPAERQAGKLLSSLDEEGIRRDDHGVHPARFGQGLLDVARIAQVGQLQDPVHRLADRGRWAAADNQRLVVRREHQRDVVRVLRRRFRAQFSQWRVAGADAERVG